MTFFLNCQKRKTFAGSSTGCSFCNYSKCEHYTTPFTIQPERWTGTLASNLMKNYVIWNYEITKVYRIFQSLKIQPPPPTN